MKPILLSLLLLALPAHAAPPGQRLVANCAACHGTDGRGQGTALPPFAGQAPASIVAAMRDFKSGARPATIMHQIAKGYSDEQIAQIAAYLSAVKK